MPRKAKTVVEVLPAQETALVPAASQLRTIVRERLVPSSSSRPRADEPQDVFERRKWSLYFKKWGCVRCNRKNLPHASKGFCSRCNSLVFQRLEQIKRDSRWSEDHPDQKTLQNIDALTSRVWAAESLLGRARRA